MDTTQVLKGMLDTAVLAALRVHPSYGYELVRRLRHDGFSDVADASVYGTLRRLHRAGLLASEIVESDAGPPRKYYALNQAGTDELARSAETWQRITSTMNRLLGGEGTR